MKSAGMRRAVALQVTSATKTWPAVARPIRQPRPTATARPCVLYARYSSASQNPLSCEDQLRACREYAQVQGWQVVAEHRDEARSGALGREGRSGWDALISAVEHGDVPRGAVVLVWDVDRWSRDWAAGMIYALLLHQFGVDLADTTSGVIDQSSTAGRVTLTLRVGGADEFLSKLRRRVTMGLADKRAAGFWTCPPPYGYTTRRETGGSVLEPDPQEVPVYLEIVRRALDLETLAGICRDLNRRGVPTKRGGPWTPATIRGLLLSPTYVGEIPVYRSREGGKAVNRMTGYGRLTTLPGRHEPLVDRGTWTRARDLAVPLAPRDVAPAADRPLSGLVRCGECGRRCYVVGRAPYLRYRCRQYGLELCGARRAAGIAALEAAVRGWALGLSRDRRALRVAAQELQRADLEAARSAAAERVPLEAAVRRIEQRAERLVEALTVGGTASTLVVQRLRQEEAALEAARARLAAVGAATAPAPLADIVAAIQRASAAGVADLRRVRPLVDRIDLPADPAAPPVLHALGCEWTLPLPPVERRLS